MDTSPNEAPEPSARTSMPTRVFALLVLLCLFAPASTRWLLGSATGAELEIRRASPAPRLPDGLADLERFADDFDAWWSDHAGLRLPLLRARSAFHWFVLGASPNPAVLRGKGDWVFLTREGAVHAALGSVRVDPRELAEWRIDIAARRDLAARAGAAYRMVLVPGKEAIYPERLPAWLGKRGPSWLRRFVDAMAEAGLPVSDQVDVLLTERSRDASDDLSYYPMGTHWSPRAAAHAAIALQHTLVPTFPALAPVDPGRVQLLPGGANRDNWAGRLHLDGRVDQPARRLLYVPPLRSQIVGPARVGPNRSRELPGVGPEELTAFVLHDSFAEFSLDVLAEPFGHLHARQEAEFDEAAILDARPALVLEYYVAHSLFDQNPTMHRPSLADPLAELFERANAPTDDLLALQDAPVVGRGGAGVRRSADDELALVRGEPHGRWDFDTRAWPEGEVQLVELELEADVATVLVVHYRQRNWGVEAALPAGFPIALEPGVQRRVVYLPRYRMPADPWLVQRGDGGSVRLRSLRVRASDVQSLADAVGMPSSPR